MGLWMARDYIKKALGRWNYDGKYWAKEALKEIEEAEAENKQLKRVWNVNFCLWCKDRLHREFCTKKDCPACLTGKYHKKPPEDEKFKAFKNRRQAQSENKCLKKRNQELTKLLQQIKEEPLAAMKIEQALKGKRNG